MSSRGDAGGGHGGASRTPTPACRRPRTSISITASSFGAISVTIAWGGRRSPHAPAAPTNKKHATGLAAFPGDGRKSKRSRMIQMLLLLMKMIMIPHLSTAPRVRPRGRRATHDPPLPALPHTSRTTSSSSAAGSSAPYLQKQAGDERQREW